MIFGRKIEKLEKLGAEAPRVTHGDGDYKKQIIDGERRAKEEGSGSGTWRWARAGGRRALRVRPSRHVSLSRGTTISLG